VCPGTPLAGRCFSGGNVGSTTVFAPAECCLACAANSSCAAWAAKPDAHVPAGKLFCVLKAAGYMPHSGNCTSGTAGPAPPPPSPVPKPPTPAPPPPGGLRFHPLFVGGAVLQHGESAAVFGTGGTPGVNVTLSLAGAPVAEAAPDAAGAWKAHLPPQPVGWSVALSAQSAASAGSSGSFSSADTTVSFGVVVLCSGQSKYVCVR
jgi:hypothetical protein